ncbi:hypothetical protein YC2023_053153 [Brassica napus]
MVGNMVYGGSPVSAALSVGRREFYALFIEEGLDWSSIPWKKEAMKSFEKVIKLAEKNTLSEFDPDLSMMEYEQEGYGLTRSVGSSSRRDIFLVAQDQEICFGDRHFFLRPMIVSKAPFLRHGLNSQILHFRRTHFDDLRTDWPNYENVLNGLDDARKS